jgi:hypothetical protein
MFPRRQRTQCPRRFLECKVRKSINVSGLWRTDESCHVYSIPGWPCQCALGARLLEANGEAIWCGPRQMAYPKKAIGAAFSANGIAELPPMRHPLHVVLDQGAAAVIRQISRGRYREGVGAARRFPVAGRLWPAASGKVAIRWADDAPVAEGNALIIDDILGTGGSLRCGQGSDHGTARGPNVYLRA